MTTHTSVTPVLGKTGAKTGKHLGLAGSLVPGSVRNLVSKEYDRKW